MRLEGGSFSLTSPVGISTALHDRGAIASRPRQEADGVVVVLVGEVLRDNHRQVVGLHVATVEVDVGGVPGLTSVGGAGDDHDGYGRVRSRGGGEVGDADRPVSLAAALK